jgi:hypothetical protein
MAEQFVALQAIGRPTRLFVAHITVALEAMLPDVSHSASKSHALFCCLMTICRPKTKLYTQNVH